MTDKEDSYQVHISGLSMLLHMSAQWLWLLTQVLYKLKLVKLLARIGDRPETPTFGGISN